MKTFLILATVCAFTVALSEPGRADVSVNFFYDNLNGGNWYDVADYGYVWHPRVSNGWAPYESGSWTMDYPYGLTWVSNEPFGWIM